MRRREKHTKKLPPDNPPAEAISIVPTHYASLIAGTLTGARCKHTALARTVSSSARMTRQLAQAQNRLEDQPGQNAERVRGQCPLAPLVRTLTVWA